MAEVIDDKIQRDFERFDKANPTVYDLYKKFAFELKEKGRKRYGISMLTERIRWEVAMATTGDEFKINNNFRSRYVRKLIMDFPELDGMFQTRETRRYPW